MPGADIILASLNWAATVAIMLDTDTQTQALLTVQDLSLSRGGRPLVRELAFEIRPGQALIVTGPNGTGKTTLLRALAGLVRPQSGEIIRTKTAETPVLLGHTLGLKSSETVGDHLEFAARFFETNISIIPEIKKFTKIEHTSRLPCSRLSAGQKQRVALARIALSGRTLWLLDEPAAPLDERGRTMLAQLVSDHRREGGAVIATTHRDLDWPDSDHLELTI